jgi:hypothetical protein
MGEYTGLIMFLWIGGAPTIGFLVLSRGAFQRSDGDSSRARTTVRPDDAVVYGSRQSNHPA